MRVWNTKDIQKLMGQEYFFSYFAEEKNGLWYGLWFLEPLSTLKHLLNVWPHVFVWLFLCVFITWKMWTVQKLEKIDLKVRENFDPKSFESAGKNGLMVNSNAPSAATTKLPTNQIHWQQVSETPNMLVCFSFISWWPWPMYDHRNLTFRSPDLFIWAGPTATYYTHTVLCMYVVAEQSSAQLYLIYALPFIKITVYSVTGSCVQCRVLLIHPVKSRH